MNEKEKYKFIPLLPQDGNKLRWYEVLILRTKISIKKLLNLWKTKRTQQ
jgi:hypothetical protein